MRWLRRLVCLARGHRFATVFWPDLEPGGFVCRRCGRVERCGCLSCQERWAKLEGA